MLPTTADIARQRLLATTLVRVAAILTLVIPLPQTLANIGIAIGFANQVFALGSGMRTPYHLAAVLPSVANIILPPILWFAAAPTARLVVPFKQSRACPACRYQIEGIQTERCPECGIDLPPELQRPTPNASTPKPDPLATVRFALRAVAIIIIAAGTIATALGVATIIGLEDNAPNLRVTIPGTFLAALIAVAGALLLKRTKRTSKSRPPAASTEAST